MDSRITLAVRDTQNQSLARPKLAIPALAKLRPEQLAQRFTQSAWSSPGGPLKKRTRRGAPKTRTGCHTCKARHKKCDETKPACNQCTSSLRKCDFVLNTLTAARAGFAESGPISLLEPDTANSLGKLLRLSSPLPSFRLSEQDGQYYQYFADLATSNFLTAVRAPIWQVILQVSQTEPSIRHVALACGTLHKIHPYVVANPSNPRFVHLYHSALQHYAVSVKILKSHLETVKGKADLASWEVSLLAAFLFTSFEALIGNEDGAHWHNVSGLKLMKSAMEAYGPVEKSLDLPGSLSDIAIGMNKRDIQVSTFGLGYETQVLLAPYVPDHFTSLDEVSHSLDSIIPNILYLIRLNGPILHHPQGSTGPLPDEDLEPRIQDLKIVLQQWLDNFQAYQNLHDMAQSKDPRFKMDRGVIACNTLMIQYWTAYIWLHTPYSSTQTIHDPYLEQFTAITELAEQILTLRPDRKDQFAADSEIIYPLFYVTQKCRDGALRRKAMDLLGRSGREGVWDGLCIAAVSSWIIDTEEEGLKQGTQGSVVEGTEGFVEERYRLRGCLIEANRLAKAVRIRAQRLDEDGKEFWVSGEVKWGVVSTVILYAEPETLWHRAQLFG